MKGLFILKEEKNQPNIMQNNNSLTLLAGCDSTEVLIKEVNPDFLTYITPCDEPNHMEFFYVLDGDITLESGKQKQNISKGESFYVSGLKKEVIIRCEATVKLLYVTSKPIFNTLSNYLDDLNDLLIQTDEKDKYTYGHGKRVMHYSLKICKELDITGKVLDDIYVSSLFHDVGKCYIPSDILNKKGRLTYDEFKCIMKHPVHSKMLLEKHFGTKIAEIAESHHERLDGSGYPNALTAENIGIEVRIISVADTFDAMTTDRPYKKAKTFEHAIKELEDLTELGLYDDKVVAALKKLYLNNKLK